MMKMAVNNSADCQAWNLANNGQLASHEAASSNRCAVKERLRKISPDVITFSLQDQQYYSTQRRQC